MAPRAELQVVLKEILGSDKVYFQPPETLKMEYPCIVYQRDFVDTRKADNRTYRQYNRYQVTVIDLDADSDIHERLLDAFPMCTYSRFYTADQLNHDVLTLFF